MKMMSPIDTNKRGHAPHYFICRISYLIIGIFIIHCPHTVFSATPIDSVAQVALSRVQIESLINRAGTTVKYGDVLIARGETVAGPLVVVDGTLFVSGTVTGDLIVLNGSASLQRDAVVTGNLIVGGGYIYASRHAATDQQAGVAQFMRHPIGVAASIFAGFAAAHNSQGHGGKH